MLEMVLTVAIVSILAGLGADIMMKTNQYFLLTRTRLDLQRQARSIMYVMSREIRQAQNATIVLTQQASQPPCSTITFTTGSGKVVTYEQIGNQLIQYVTPSGKPTQKMVLTKNLEYLAFSFPRSDDLTIISLSLTLQEIISQGREKSLHTASQQIQVMN